LQPEPAGASELRCVLYRCGRTMKRSRTLFFVVQPPALVSIMAAVYLLASNASAATSNDVARGEG
jgi:hypothetical protein